jgi:hypothetical protein
MTEYFNLIDQINIDNVVKELESCPEIAWTQVEEWTRPQANKIYNLYQTGVIADKKQLFQRLARTKDVIIQCDESREQDRLHLIWQMTNAAGNSAWWIDRSWRDQPPSINPEYGKFFDKTIQQISSYWESQDKQLSRLFFSRLQPGRQVYPHQDGAWGCNYENIRRYGLVVSTNNECELTVGDITVNPDPGTLFWIDGGMTHSATNPATASEPRIFLYMDVDICPNVVDT